MPTRTAHTTWTGGLQDGTGVVTLVSSGVGTYEVNFPKRAADNADGTTSPEELIAAAHSACFAMQFSALLGAAGGTDPSLDVTADVTLGPDGNPHAPAFVVNEGTAQAILIVTAKSVNTEKRAGPGNGAEHNHSAGAQ